MIFIQDLIKINDTKYSIGQVFYNPFHERFGLGKTKEQLEQEGKLLELPPKMEEPQGKEQVLYYNPSTNSLFWEYVDIAVHKDPLQEQLNELGQTVAQEKLKNMQKDAVISNLGQELSKAKLDIIKLQGGNK